MLIPQDTLVLVGDGRKAIFLRNKGGAGHPDLVAVHVMEHSNPPTRAQGSDRPGRYSGPNGSRSAVEQTDWHQLEEDRFATDVAEALYVRAHQHEFERIIVVAPPRTLGTMRHAFRKEVAQKVSKEIAKDLVSHDLSEIARLLVREPSD
jgi:protein required for attachment to host cells